MADGTQETHASVKVTDTEGKETNDWLEKIFSGMTSMGLQLAGSVPTLIHNAPQMLQQMSVFKEQPLLAQLVIPMVNQLLGMTLDWATGTGDSDLRASDFLNNPNERTLQLTRAARRKERELDGFADKLLDESADAFTEQLAKSLYGEGAQKDSIGYKAIAKMVKATSKPFADAAESIMGEAAFEGREIFGVDFSQDATLRKSDLDILSKFGIKDTTSRKDIETIRSHYQDMPDASGEAFAERHGTPSPLTTEQATAFERALARQKQMEVGQRLFKLQEEMTFGYKDAQGNFVEHITGTMTTSEVSSIVAELAKAGKTEEQIKAEIQKIAGGVDGLKQAFGTNTGLAQAEQIVNHLYGFNVRGLSNQAFNMAGSNLRYASMLADLTTEDLLGNQKEGKTGYITVMQNILKNLGVKQHTVSSTATTLGGLTKDRSAGMYGVSNDEYYAIVGQHLAQQEMSGTNDNAAIALTAWADEKGKDIAKLTKTDRDEFFDWAQEKGINFDDAASVMQAVGAGTYMSLRGSESVKIAKDSMSWVQSELMREKDKEVHDYAAQEIFKEGRGELFARAGITREKLFKSSALEIEERIRKSHGLNQDEKDRLLQSITSGKNYLEYTGYVWREGYNKEAAKAQDESVRSNYAQGVTGLRQAFNRNPELNLKEAVSIFVGTASNTEGLSHDDKIKKLVEGGLTKDEAEKLLTAAKEGRNDDEARKFLQKLLDSDDKKNQKKVDNAENPKTPKGKQPTQLESDIKQTPQGTSGDASITAKPNAQNDANADAAAIDEVSLAAAVAAGLHPLLEKLTTTIENQQKLIDQQNKIMETLFIRQFGPYIPK